MLSRDLENYRRRARGALIRALAELEDGDPTTALVIAACGVMHLSHVADCDRAYEIVAQLTAKAKAEARD